MTEEETKGIGFNELLSTTRNIMSNDDLKQWLQQESEG